MSEIWKQVPFNSAYEVSNLGRVRSLKRSTVRILSPRRNSGGHLDVALCDKGKPKSIGIHQLVMLAFVGPQFPGMDVCHNDGNPENNQLSNLRYDTHKANMADKVLHGTAPRGSRNGMSRLTINEVQAIRDMRNEGHGFSAIARALSIPHGTVWNVASGYRWSHLQNEQQEAAA